MTVDNTTNWNADVDVRRSMGGGAAHQSPEAEPQISVCMSQFEERVRESRVLTSKLERILDRLVGNPTGERGDANKRDRKAGLVGQFEAYSEDLSEQLARQHNIVDAIAQIV